MRKHISRLWWSVLLVLYLPACAGFNDLTGPKAVPNVVASVEVPVTQSVLSVGGTMALQALVRDAGGRLVSDHAVTWTTSDATIARVSPEGLVTAIGVGLVKIAATSEGRSAVATLTIAPRAVASVRVNVPTADIFVGAQLQLSSTTLGEAGDVLTGRTVFWSSSDPKIASIDNIGLLSGLSVGIATITATSEGQSATVGISVLPVPVRTVQVAPGIDSVVVGQTTQLTASARDSIGTPLTDRVITWTSSDNAIATVSSSGLVVGVQAGVVTISANAEGKSGTARITVRPRPVGTVIVSPAQASVTVGQSVKLQVLITDDNGTLLTGRPIQYTSANGGIAQVAADGTVTGISQGSTIITVTSEGRSGTVAVAVGASPIATVRINPETANILIGTAQKLSAALLDAGGNALAQRSVTWLSGAPGVATVATDGTVSAVGAGTAIIFATVEGKIAQATITVRDIAVNSVTLSPAASTMIVGDALDLVDQIRESGGALLANRVVTWSSSDDRIAVVSSTGRVRALAVGQALITATSGGVSGASAITVTSESVLTVTADPSSLSLLPGGSATVIGTPRGRNGVVLSGRAVSFASSDATIATVTTAGVVTGIKTGTASITVSSEGKSVLVPVTVSPAPVAAVTVALADPARFVGQTTQATAVTRDAGGNNLPGRAVAWTTSNALVATVSPSGVVTAIAAGSANIIATSEGKTGSATITVSIVPVATVNVTLANAARFVGQTTQATAVTLDANGNTISGRSVTWSSSNTAVATVSPTGAVTTIAPGIANIIATSETKTGQAQLSVALIPVASVSVTLANPARFVAQTTQATVVLRDANNVVLIGRAVTWTSSNTDVATVSSTGAVTAVGAGSANITATSEGQIGFATINVTPAPVASVAVTLANPTRFVGQTTQATAILKDASGNVLTGRTIAWTTSNAAIATVSQTGLVTGVGPSVTTISITATSEGVAGSAPILITLAPVGTVVVTAPSSAMLVGQTQQASVVLRDDNNNVLTGRTVSWGSSNVSVANVSASGAITALSSGTTTISATSETKTGSIVITVSQVPVASVAVTLAQNGLTIGQTTTATAVMRDAAGNVLPGRTATWTSSDPLVATVSFGGIVTGKAAGTANIIATSEGIIGSAQVVVSVVPVGSVSMTLTLSTIFVNDISQASVTTRDADDNVLTGRLIAFSSTNPAVATVSNTGAVTGVAAGQTTILATSEGKFASAPITVVNRPVTAVAVSLGSSAITVLQSTQAAAVLRASNNAVLSGRPITWSSSNNTVASVSATGVVTGLLPGTADITATSEGISGSATVNVSLAPVASVSVTLIPSSVTVGQTAQASAIARDGAGITLTGRLVTFTSSNTNVATVNTNTGVITAVNAGTTDITAASEGKSGAATLSVSIAPVATVAVSLAPSTITLSQTSQASAVLKDAGGNNLGGRVIAWSSSNSSVATINSSTGFITAVGTGSTNITATAEGKSNTAILTVTTVPVNSVVVTLAPSSITAVQSSQANAVLKDAGGNTLVGRAVAWSSSNTSVATVNSTTGAIVAVAVGSTDISATSEGKSSFATLTVSAAPVAAVAVTLLPTSVAAGAPAQATAVLTDALGNTLNGRIVVWSSTNISVATVNASTGLVTSLSAGTTSITATSEGKSNAATLTVTAAPVATVTVTLAATTIAANQTVQATAALKDAGGNALAGRLVAWTTSNSAVATVDGATGLVTAVAVGTVNIIATSEGKTNFATLNITIVPVATVAVTLTPSTIPANGMSQGSAVLKDGNGNVLSGRGIVWSSSNNVVATVNASTGLITAVAAGTATITATSETKFDSKVLTVTLAPVATVTVSISPATANPSQTAQATAVVKDGNGTTLNGRNIVWSSSNTNVATINSATGAISALAIGNTDITATSETKTGVAPFSVVSAPVATVALTLTPATITTSQMAQASAVLKDAAGNVLSNRTISYGTTNTSVATVSSTGLISPVGPGTTQISAISEGQSDTKLLTVTMVPVATVAVTLAPTSIPVGQSSQGTAVVKDAGGNTLANRTIVWSSSNTAIATVVASTGAVTAVAAGTADIVATSETKTNFATITVTAASPPPVATVALTLTPTSINTNQTSQGSTVLKDAGGNVLTNRTVGWGTSNPGVATISGTGAITPVAAGTVTIIAISEGQSDSKVLTVTDAPVASITVTLSATTIPTGQTAQATAVLKDATGKVLTNRNIVWSSANTNIASVLQTGVVTGVGPSVTAVAITATSEGVAASASILVTALAPAPVATVAVTLSPATINAVQTSVGSAVLKDANGNTLSRTVTWTSSNTNVATINSGSGAITAVAEGSTTITATSESKNDSKDLTVTAAPVANVSVTLGVTTLNVGLTTQAAATLTDAKAQPLAGRSIVWTSSDISIATVTSSGVVTAVKKGTASIIATSEGVSGSTPLQVP